MKQTFELELPLPKSCASRLCGPEEARVRECGCPVIRLLIGEKRG